MLFFHQENLAADGLDREGDRLLAKGGNAKSSQSVPSSSANIDPVFEYAMEIDQVGGPWALAAYGDYVLVAEWGMHRIRVIHVVAKTGELRPALTYGSFGYLDEPGRFNHPRGIAVQQSTGLVVVSDENNHLQVLKFVQHPVPRFTHVSSLGRPSHGAVVSGGQHSGSGGRRDTMGFFNLPTGVVIHDESGLVFVADSKNHRIQTLRLTQDGKLHPISMFGAGGQFTFKAMPEVR